MHSHHFRKGVFTAILLLLFTAAAIVSSLAAPTFAAAASEYVTIVRTGAERPGPSFKGNEPGAAVHRLHYAVATVQDRANTAGYCITPFARGTSPDGQPQTFAIVPEDQLDALDKQLLGILLAGYPNVNYGWRPEDQYMATGIAIQHFLFQHPDKYPNRQNVKFASNDWSHWEDLAIMTLAKIIYEEGMKSPYTPGAVTSAEIKATAENGGHFNIIADTLSLKIAIETSGSFQFGKMTLPAEIRSMMKSGQGSVTIDGKPATFKSYILGSADSSEGIAISPSDKEIVITLDKRAAEAYVSASYAWKTVEVLIETSGGAGLQPYIGNNIIPRNQNYAFLAAGSAAPAAFDVAWTAAEEYQPPEDNLIAGSGGLKILKYNKTTNQLTSGAIFEIRGVSANNWDFLVHIQASPGAALPLPGGGTAATGVGVIELRGIRPGQYQITEISPPPYFDYCSLGQNAQVVTVVDGDSGLYPQARFENNPFATLRIRKVDAVTGSPVGGAILRIRNAITGLDVEMTTANGGVVEIKNLPQGNYEITEVFAPSKYTLSGETKVAALRWGETTDVTFANQPKTEAAVNKVDGETGQALAGALFRLTKPDTGDVWEAVTYYDGCALFLDIPEGTYILEEILAPAGYLLDGTKRTLVVRSGKPNELFIPNFKEPTLMIRKVDEDTGAPLAGAEFRVAKMGGQVVYEGLTGADGTIRLGGLSPEWYKVTEIAAPSGYLVATEPKDVLFEPNQVLEVKFDNRRRPALEILKLDEQTNAPLAGAVFHVHKAEDATVSEYVTGVDGKILVTDLEEAVYSVVEAKAPDGYLPDPRHKYIQLAWGKTAQLAFTNKARPGLRILKVDAVTGQPLPYAEFRVSKVQGATVSEYITDASGEILIAGLDEGLYRAEEFMAPNGYLRVDGDKEIALEWGQTKTLKFDNIRKPVAVFLKTNALTGAGIPGATFRVVYEMPGGGLKYLGSFITGADGRIILPKAEPGWYVFTETLPAPGFSLPSNPVTRIYFAPGDNAYLDAFAPYYTGASGQGAGGTPQDGANGGQGSGNAIMGYDQMQAGSGSAYLAEGGGFNWPLNSIVIRKTHAITGELLAGAAFELYRADEQVSGVPGTAIGRFTTDNSGVVVITGLAPGYYVVKEVQAPLHFLISENSQQNGFLKADGTTILEFTFTNYPYGALLISKMDALTGAPLAGARFKVTDAAGAVLGDTNGEYVTGSSGEILIPHIKPGAVVATEIQAPPHYAMDTTPQTIQIGTDGKTYKASFANQSYGGIAIRKMDAAAGEPLAGVEFTVTRSDGGAVGSTGGVFLTDAQGLIHIPHLPKGSYIVAETKTLPTHILESQPRVVLVEYGQTTALDFYNRHKSGLQIIKSDADTKLPLKGAKFTVYKMNGEIAGVFETNGDGVVILESLEPGWYKVAESKAPEGYLLDDAPRDVEVTAGQFLRVHFEDKRIGALLIKKTNEADGAPLAGAVFTVAKQNGELVGEYTTGADGLISVPIMPGWYIVAEKQAPSGFLPDASPKTVEAKAAAPTVVAFTNTPLSGLLIVKTDANTGKPLAGAVFDVTHADGRRVAGSILDGNQPGTEVNSPSKTLSPNGDISGSYTTDANGRILINALQAGEYHITERQAPAGYELDTGVHAVTVTPGKLATLQLANKPKAGFRLYKTDSLTKKPIYNVEFMVLDSNNAVVGTYYTDNNGMIDFGGILPEGCYTIRETKAAPGYYPDDVPRAVEFRAGRVTEIRWENTPKMGQIQILKKSGDDNEVNALPAGSPLAGAVFEAYEHKSGNLADRFVSGADGRAVSKPLPLGHYTIKEVQAPPWYKLSTQALDMELEFATQIVKTEFLNYAANTGVTIRKTGSAEAMPGDVIRYDIRELKNTSAVPLSDFYWRDVLPVDAVRLTKIVTGTYSQALQYKILVTTSKGESKVIADNLSATKNNVIDCAAASLGLKNDEYVTSFTLLFGTVKAGFAIVEQPQVYVKVNGGLPNGYPFANKADVGGKYGAEWVVGNSTWLTTLYAQAQPEKKLPRTGY